MRGLLTAGLIALALPAAARPVGGPALYQARCALCHVGYAPGVVMLEKRLGKAKSLLAERSDLQPAYVKGVVRRGLRSMPAITRTEITDAELDQVAAYLTRNTPAQGAP